MNLDLKFRLISEYIGIGDSQEAYLVERIRSVRDEFSEENFFLCIEGVDDDVHESMWRKGYLPTSAIKGMRYVSHLAPS